MTISDTDLEERIRDLRRRADDVPPPPSDLADLTRARYRVERRRRVRQAVAGVAAALVVVGVPAVAGQLGPVTGRQDVAAPSSPTRSPAPSLYDAPTRGSLAGDQEWLAGVRELDWVSPEMAAEAPPGYPLPEPPVATRKVAWAGEVAGGRVALVLGRTEELGPVQAWFTGRGDATPDEMALVGAPGEAPRLEPTALLAAPDRRSGQPALVVVGMPGDEAEVLTGRTVTASAEVVDHWEPMPMDDGAGALVLDGSYDWTTGMQVHVSRSGQGSPLSPHLSVGDEQITASLDREPVEIADPRGLRVLVDEGELQWAARHAAGSYGVPVQDLGPTLLAAGPVGGGSESSALMVGLTFPSGATGAVHVSYWFDRNDQSSTSSMMITLAPAGTALMEQVFAVPTSNSITVSGPASGVLAEIYLADGTLHATLPLVDGAGVGPLGPPAADRVRILDARGTVVAGAPLSRPNG